jgi:hypothetical protein
MLVAHVFRNRIHEIFESGGIPDWPPYPDGKPPLLIEIPSTVNLDDGYNPVTKQVIPEPVPEEREGYWPEVTWNDETYQFDVVYHEIEAGQPTALS